METPWYITYQGYIAAAIPFAIATLYWFFSVRIDLKTFREAVPRVESQIARVEGYINGKDGIWTRLSSIDNSLKNLDELALGNQKLATNISSIREQLVEIRVSIGIDSNKSVDVRLSELEQLMRGLDDQVRNKVIAILPDVFKDFNNDNES